MKEKVVGILGGMGPYATVDLFRKIIEHTPAKKDWEHLRIIVDNNPKIPSRSRAILFHEQDPTEMLIETAKNLEKAGADFIVMPCNSAHLFYPVLSAAVNIPILNIITETVAYITDNLPGIRRVSILAAEVVLRAGLYQDRLKEKGIATVIPTEEQQRIIRELIESIKLNKFNEDEKSKLMDIIDALVQKGVEAIIVGCTEISIVVEEFNLKIPVFDSNQILAQAAVEKAKNIRRF